MIYAYFTVLYILLDEDELLDRDTFFWKIHLCRFLVLNLVSSENVF